MVVEELELVEGDTLPLLAGAITKNDGAPEDITGWVIKLHIDYPTPLVKVAEIPEGTDGYYQFVWAGGDLVPGRWKAELQIESSLGIQTFQKTQSNETIYLRIFQQIA